MSKLLISSALFRFERILFTHKQCVCIPNLCIRCEIIRCASRKQTLSTKHLQENICLFCLQFEDQFWESLLKVMLIVNV